MLIAAVCPTGVKQAPPGSVPAPTAAGDGRRSPYAVPASTAPGGATVALVTGATSGIGAAFADRLASDGHDLVLVARGEERLRDSATALSRRTGVVVEVIVADLSTTDGQQRVAHRLACPSLRQRPVELLINNAGGATALDFADTDPADLRAALELNVGAVAELTRAALHAMVGRGRGAIVNVSSVNAFFALPGGGAGYAAAKSYVKVLSEGVALSLVDSPVHVMALCPGSTRTGFQTRNGTRDGLGLEWLRHSPEWVADRALADLRRRRVVSIPGTTARSISVIGRLLPHHVMAAAVRCVRAGRGRRPRGAPPG